jgi:3-deoxy-D-manno-octulosonic acid kinase
MSGRGPVYAVPTPGGIWVVRHFMRGGSVASLLGDRYLHRGKPRPFREAAASQIVRGRGIATPKVIAAAVYRSGAFYRGDLVTELVPDSEELCEVLFDPERRGLAGTRDRKEALQETGSLIARMARAGVRHPDLNAKNVLIQWSGGSPTAHVLDLDRTRVGPGPAPVTPMVQRLLRSLRKLERRSGLKLPEAEEGLLVAAAEAPN